MSLCHILQKQYVYVYKDFMASSRSLMRFFPIVSISCESPPESSVQNLRQVPSYRRPEVFRGTPASWRSLRGKRSPEAAARTLQAAWRRFLHRREPPRPRPKRKERAERAERLERTERPPERPHSSHSKLLLGRVEKSRETPRSDRPPRGPNRW